MNQHHQQDPETAHKNKNTFFVVKNNFWREISYPQI